MRLAGWVWKDGKVWLAEVPLHGDQDHAEVRVLGQRDRAVPLGLERGVGAVFSLRRLEVEVGEGIAQVVQVLQADRPWRTRVQGWRDGSARGMVGLLGARTIRKDAGPVSRFGDGLETTPPGGIKPSEVK